MKVLIMVLSSLKSPYDKLMRAQQDTWDKSYLDGVSTIYYYGGSVAQTYHLFGGQEIVCACSDDYEMMHWKFKLALDHIWNLEWDYIFRTNSSTYVRKDKIYNFLKDKPREKYYAGVNGGNFASGTGAILSRDCADIIRKEFDSHPNPSEDTLIGTTLEKHGIGIMRGAERVHFNFAENKIIDADYYRCKSELMFNGQLDRNEDVKAFYSLYNHFKENEIKNFI